MKPEMSSLNPYAASYVPILKREAEVENKTFKLTAEDPKSDNVTAWSKPSSKAHKKMIQNELPDKAYPNFNIHGNEKLLVAENFTQKNHQSRGSHDSWSRNPSDMTEKQHMNEDFEMDLAYLSITFPGMSDQSLADVYSANGGDLEASVDMLNQLEFYPTMDIAHASESGSSAKGASVKPKKISCEASGSSSGPSKSAS
ncbi:hypothetical protein HHK36_014046 [Tetracentron sinense]|uniref:CUE domain-containing protein n=1 Tax=Tetracentron sinense TaxID=13715 RepID=A0A834ZBJ2_TETSI|nr:hypothetical protein HHK36_014046 [Tetracentron sinense]